MPLIVIDSQQAVHGGSLGLLPAGSTQDVPLTLAHQLVGAGRARWVTPPTSRVGMLDLPADAVQGVVSRAGVTASDAGTDWIGAPSLLSFSAALASGTSTTVLLEVRDSAGTVATAATITADTVGQTMDDALLMLQRSEYRFRRSSGTGSVTITV